MATEFQTRPSPMKSRDVEPTVRSIIDAARSTPVRTASRPAWMCAGLSGLLLWASFPPLDWGSLGWIALVPLLLLVRPVLQPRRMILATYVCGLISQAFLLQWLRYGDPAMYVAWIALAVYTAMYFPVFVLLSRAAVHRFRVPFVFAIPVIWVGLEFFRAHLLTGFSWYYLGHTQYRWIELIQISDLVGAYGVSFVVACSSAALALVLPDTFLARLGLGMPANVVLNQQEPRASKWRAAASVGFSIGLVVASVAYGYVRRAQAQFTAGPRIALIQGNFTAQVKHDPAEASSIFNQHYRMTGDAVKYQPDIIVWPETMYRDPLMIPSPDLSETDLLRVAPHIPAMAWKSSHVPEVMHDLSTQAGAAMIFGVDSYVADSTSLKNFNSAVLSVPSTGIVSRYDKIHRVIFGEYIPLKETFPFLRGFVPYGANFGLDAGAEAKAFDYGQWRLAPIICFEDTVPHLVRGILTRLTETGSSRKPVDCLVNLTNDGWFHGSSGLDQHLIAALFRCVECRKPMVRAVNTGISAVIDGDGIVVEPEVLLNEDTKSRTTMRDPKTGRWRRQMNAVLVDSVPLDNRTSFYLKSGDWFAGACGFAALFMLLACLIPRKRRFVWTTGTTAG